MEPSHTFTQASVYWDDFTVGDSWRTRGRTITEPDLVAFLNLSWITEELFTNHHDRPNSAIAGRLVPGSMVFACAEGLTLAAVNIKGFAFLHSDVDMRRATFLGDTIHVVSSVVELRAATKPDRGLCRTRNEVVNQHGEPVLVYTALRLLEKRR